MPDDPLADYLNDHLAGSVAAIELVSSMHADNQGQPFGDFSAWLLGEIEADKATLEAVMQRLGVTGGAIKRAGAAAAERLGRLRFKERVTGSTALSRLLELETVSVGIAGKLGLWNALLEVAPSRPELAAKELEHLVARAHQQLGELEPHRLASAREAFGTS